ncbi:peptidoglycan bridge formation glycyltransferase FemA/FemB family protein [Candidatus Saccharibacteria bacterium]|nr:peptidoglycan bridge formation glycyltransferase FemA/FemB family protein [Candidatus Saccharibacteria bacterium]
MQLPSNWNQTIQSRGGHVLQSAEWASFQASIGRQPYYGMSDTWYWLAFNRQVTGLHYLLAAHNPIVTKDIDSALEALKIKASDLHCDFIRIEPVGKVTAEQMLSLGAKKIGDVQPAHTLVLNLTKSEDELRSGLESGHRNRINTAEKRGVSVHKTADLKMIPAFLRLLHDTADRAKITNHPDWYYQKMAENLIGQGMASFYVATVENKPASISLIFDWGDTRYYAHTGNDQILNRQYKAAVSNVWQMILDAKADGKKYFDFWGIAPPDQPNHPWAGITGFKKGFGGDIIGSVGSWDIPINRAKYQLYTAYRKMRGRK